MNAQAKIEGEATKKGGQVTVSATDLLKAVRFASQVVERRNTIPVLGTILAVAGPGSLTITGTDLDISCEMTVEAECATPFATCIGPRALETLMRFATGAVTLTLHDGALTVAAGDITAKFRELIPMEDFPVMKDEMFQKAEGPTPSAEIPEAVLCKVLSDTIPCISTEETRYYLNGVYLHAKDDGFLRGVATDGHRLALRKSNVPFAGLDGIILEKAAKAIHRSLRPDGNRSIRIYGTEFKRVIAPETGEWVIRMKLINGTFPDYTRVIPTAEPKISVPISHGQIQRLRSLAAIGMRPYGSIALSFDPERALIRVECIGIGLSVTAPLPGGVGPAFGINSKYVADMTRRYGTLRLESAGPGDPFMMLTEDPDLTLVVMPMRV
jgi:DNA polymerase-3 subunit beta